MFAMIFAPDSRTTGVHRFQLQEKHKNAIRKLKIPLSVAPDKSQESAVEL
jgi:hypothetical protein